MKKLEDTFLFDSKRIIKNEKLINFKNYVKDNSLLIFVAYFVGVIGIFIRNYSVGLPFFSVSLIQAFIIFLYFLLFLTAYALLEYLYVKLYEEVKRKNKRNIIIYSAYILLSIVTLCLILVFLLMNFFMSFFVVLYMYILYPLFVVYTEEGDKTIGRLISIIVFYYFIMLIPIQYGGLKEQKVMFINYASGENVCYLYDYYGNSDGLYLFKKDNRVILVPMENGYIMYDYHLFNR